MLSKCGCTEVTHDVSEEPEIMYTQQRDGE